MSYLEALARGLRGAGGVLSPGAFQAGQESDMLAQRGAQAAALQEQAIAARKQALDAEMGFRAQDRQDARAQRLFEFQQTQAARQQELIDRHKQRMEELAQRNADAVTRMQADQEFRRQMAEQAAQSRRDMMTFAASLRQEPAPTITEVVGADGKSYKIDARTNRVIGEAPRSAVDAGRDQATIDRQTEGLSKRGDVLAPLYSGINEVNKLITPLVEKGASIPGVGYGSNVKILGMDVSGPLLGEQGKNIRSAVQNVANKILKAESGAAVTLPEQVRQDLANMATGQFSENDFLNAWPRIVAAMQSNLDNVGAGYRPEAVKQYRERGGSLPFGEKIPVPKRPQESSGTIDQNKLDAALKKYGN